MTNGKFHLGTLSVLVAGSRRKVLIVDDDRVTSETLTMIFSQQGYDARYARSGEEALRLIAEWEPEFALIDVILPGINGVAFAMGLSGTYPNCRTVLFTGDMAAAELMLSARNSDREFQILAKPVHPTALLETAKRLLA